MSTKSFSDYINLLRNNICEVNFTKKDGTRRIMKCTLMSDYLPVTEQRPAIFRPRTDSTVMSEDPTSISVWDVTKNSWRAFNIASVNSIKIIVDNPPQDGMV